MINPMNFLMNRFGLKRTTTVVATTVVAATLMYQAYNAYKARKARKAGDSSGREVDPPAREHTAVAVEFSEDL